MNPQQPFSQSLGTLAVVASETLSQGNDLDGGEPQTSSTEDMSDQSKKSPTMEGTTSANMLQLSSYLVSGGPSRMESIAATTHEGVASGPFQQLENGTKTDGETNIEEDRQRDHKKRSKNWTRAETLNLIKARTELDERFRKSARKVSLWDEIALSLQRANFSRDGKQCKDKWEKLTTGYKEVRDGTRDKEDHPFHKELHPLLSRKSYKRESDVLGDDADAKRVKFEFRSSHVMPNWKPLGMSGAVNHGSSAMEIREVQKEEPTSPGKCKKAESMSFIDFTVIQELLETIVNNHQRFFKELLDAVERKEQLREQIRHEREEKWRAEEQAQRLAVNNAMIVLTQRLLEERYPGVSMAIMPAQMVTPPNGLVSPKMRSKNWKKTEVFNLIRFRQEMEDKFAKSTRRAGLWEELGEKLGSLGIHRDGKQCREKWDKVMAEYKDVVDGRKEKEESPYFAELTTLFGRAKEPEIKASPETTKEEFVDI